MTSPADLLVDQEDSGELRFPALGIVAAIDDEARQHRVQCIIPVVDEDEIYPVWARRVSMFAGPPGYGDFHPPAIGTEVVLWGLAGEPHHLIYAPLYNEDFPIPSDFADAGTRGVRSDGDYKVITAGNLILRAGKIIIEADASVIITGPAGIFQKSGSEGA